MPSMGMDPRLARAVHSNVVEFEQASWEEMAKSLRQAKAALSMKQDAVTKARTTEKTDFSELSASFQIADGIARLRQTLTGARLAQRTYSQECFGPDDVTAALVPRTTSLSYAALSELDDGAGAATAYTFRVRTITGDSGGEVARARFRYLVSGGGTANLKVTTGIASYATGSLTSATWAWSPWLAVRLKANATGHLESVHFEGKTTAGTLYVSGWILEENVS